MSAVAVLSASQVGTFSSCSLKWHFRYREKAPEERRSVALVIGSAVDVAIKTGVHLLRSGEVRVEALETERVFQAAWDAELASNKIPIDWGKKGQDGQREMALAVTRAFLDAEDLPERVARIRSLDVRFELPVVDPVTGLEVPGLRLLGFLDAIERTPEGLRPLDYKTAASRAGYDEQSLSTHLQGSLYSWALHQLHPEDATDEMAFQIGLKLKMPMLEDRVVTLGESARRRALLTVLHAHRAMDLGVAFPQPSFLCGGCGYQRRCAGWQDQAGPPLALDPFARAVC